DRDDRSIRYRLAEKMRFLGDGQEGDGDEERFYQDALALHLDREDLFIRRMLATKMRLLAERREADPAPDDAALEAYLDLHADRYREPERTSLWHVFVSSARGTACERAARALPARVREERRRERRAAAMAGLRAKYGVQRAGAAQESRG